MNKSESKYFSTAERMDDALIHLLETKGMEYITVKDICTQAGVNRSTFYLHYETIGDLLQETLEYANRKFQSYYPNDSYEHFVRGLDEAKDQDLILISAKYLDPYLKYVRENRSIFRAMLSNPSGTLVDSRMKQLVQQIVVPILNRFHVPEEEHRYWIAYSISGIVAIIREWLVDDCSLPDERIQEIIIHNVRPYCR